MCDQIGWAATAIMVVAGILIAHKKVSGMWLMLLGNIMWGVVGYNTDLESLVGSAVVHGTIDIYSIVIWGRHENREEARHIHSDVY